MTGRKKELIKYEIHGRIVECEPDETLKYEVADELGLLDKVIDSGWKQLSAREAGRIGGISKIPDEKIARESWCSIYV